MSDPTTLMMPVLYDMIMAEIHKRMDANPLPGTPEAHMLHSLATVAELYEQQLYPSMFPASLKSKPACELTHLEAITALIDAEVENIKLRQQLASLTPPPGANT